MTVYLEDLQDLVRGGCQTPGCTHNHDRMVAVARCHPKARVDAIITASKGVIDLRCGQCERAIVTIAVASRPAIDLLPEKTEEENKSEGQAP